MRWGAACGRSAQHHDCARRRSYAAYDATDRWWVVTDHGRLLAATHDHARDRRENVSGGGRDGGHEQVFWKVNGLDYSGGFFAGKPAPTSISLD
ncbi:hypothetical protein PRtIB026_A44670 [Pseudomonas sp. RtIB026]|nr:hypothetical protein PRtIB026_A44670 [Pseudomonas sp. RtIB026]